MAVLALDMRTSDLELIVRAAAHVDLDTLLSDTTLEVNDKWLHFHASHKKSPCRVSRGKAENYSPDHFSPLAACRPPEAICAALPPSRADFLVSCLFRC